MVGGSARIQGLGGGYGDYGIFIGAFVAEGVEIDDYFSENDLRGIESDGPAGPVTLTNNRMSNGNQLADGFFKFAGQVFLEGTKMQFPLPREGVLIGDYAVGGNAYLTSISNYFKGTWAEAGYSSFTVPVTSIGDDVASAPGTNVLGGCFGKSIPCLYVNDHYAGGNPGSALQVNMQLAFPSADTSTRVAFSSAQTCTSAASPASCGLAPSGTVAVPPSSTTLMVNTKAVSANSQIRTDVDSSLGTALRVTCNTTPVQGTVSARSVGRSFTITVPLAPTLNPACFSYTIVN